jgi:hypothetical protein
MQLWGARIRFLRREAVFVKESAEAIAPDVLTMSKRAQDSFVAWARVLLPERPSTVSHTP